MIEKTMQNNTPTTIVNISYLQSGVYTRDAVNTNRDLVNTQRDESKQISKSNNYHKMSNGINNIFNSKEYQKLVWL
jgi:hypothetical protein